jgi:hypothetical protein
VLGAGDLQGFVEKFCGPIIVGLFKERLSEPKLKPRAEVPISLFGNQSERFFEQMPRHIEIPFAARGQGESTAITRLTFKAAKFLCQRKSGME